VRLGHVALDGTKVRANASKHKAMSYGRMEEKIAELESQVAELLSKAAGILHPPRLVRDARPPRNDGALCGRTPDLGVRRDGLGGSIARPQKHRRASAAERSIAWPAGPHRNQRPPGHISIKAPVAARTKARLNGVQGVPGSNPGVPTNFPNPNPLSTNDLARRLLASPLIATWLSVLHLYAPSPPARENLSSGLRCDDLNRGPPAAAEGPGRPSTDSGAPDRARLGPRPPSAEALG
jgi:hypothetical protein